MPILLGTLNVSEWIARFRREGSIKRERDGDHMIIDCSDCKVRDIACADCVVTVLLGPPGTAEGRPVDVGIPRPRIALDQEELGAMDVLAESGLVPKLRLVVGPEQDPSGGSLPARDTSGDRRAI